MTELRLTLVENAEDFLREAVRHAAASTPRDWKYAILHLSSALELLLKAILQKNFLDDRLVWAANLLFDDIDAASQERLQRGDFESVRFTAGVKRLREIAGVTLEPRTLKYLKRLRHLRNRTTHFSLSFNVEQAKSLVARGVSAFLTLQQEHLHSLPEKALEYEINETLRSFEKYVSERLRSTIGA